MSYPVPDSPNAKGISPTAIVRTVAELSGFAALTVAAFLVDLRLGIAVLGIALLLIANGV